MRTLLILFFVHFCGLFTHLSGQAPLIANAGGDKYNVCPNQTVPLSGSATGGTPPYSYQWTPGTGLSNSNSANPTANPGTDTWYIFQVTDATGATHKDTIAFIYNPIKYVGAGPNVDICSGQTTATIGLAGNSSPFINYSWSPATGLSSATAGNPTANPPSTTTYTLTASTSFCPTQTSTVTLTVHSAPQIDAGPTIVIKDGERATMQATGPEGASYWWSPDTDIRYNGSPVADAEPNSTTLYSLWVTDDFGCGSWDTVRVIVLETDEIFIYNAFTPNGDGENDSWHIGNIHRFPESKVQIFNRYGKLVYTKIGYTNDWFGTTFGEQLPSATYYYVIDLGNGKPAYTGDVTIIR